MSNTKKPNVMLLPVNPRGLSKNQLIDLEGYTLNAGRGLDTVQFCIAQIDFLRSKGVPDHAEIMIGYRNEMALAAMYETHS